MMTNVRSRAFPLAALLILAGCGGSDDDGGSTNPTPNPTGTAVVTGFDLSWAPRTRLVTGPASALSVVVTFLGAGSNGRDVVTTINRLSDPAGYIQTYPTAGPVLTGVRTARFEFHAAAGGAGAIVATADLGGLVRGDGSFARADGSSFGSIRTIGRVASVVVTGPATIDLGVPTSYGAAAFDAEGNPLALSPGSFSFSSLASPITPDGTLTPLAIGTETISASADGVSSPSIQARVQFGQASGLRVVDQPTTALTFSTTGRLFATTGATGANPNSLLEITPTTGEVRVIAALGGQGDALGASIDGSTVYVAVGNSIFRVDAATGSLSAPIALGTSAFSDPYRAESIAVSPIDSSIFVVGRRFTGGGGYGGAALYRDGVLRAQTSTSFNYDGGLVRFSEDGTNLYDYNTQTTGFGLIRYVVGADTLTEAARRSGVVEVFNTSYTVAGGRIYFSTGQILDGGSLAELGRFATDSFPGSVALSADGSRIFFGPGQAGSATLTAFDTATRARVANISLGVSAQGPGAGAAGRFAVPLDARSGGSGDLGGVLLINAATATGNRSRR